MLTLLLSLFLKKSKNDTLSLLCGGREVVSKRLQLKYKGGGGDCEENIASNKVTV